MTFSELLRTVSFDDLIPTLKRVYEVTDIYSYREAFDELMLIGNVVDGDGVIEVTRDEEDDSWIHVCGCHNCWREVIASRIEVADGVKLSDVELAAYILWEMTFYRFSEDELPSFRRKPDNEYSRRWSEVYSRQQVMYARGRNEKRECFRETMSWDIAERIGAREKKRNRAKRMRDARMEREMARLERMSNVEECIKELTRVCPELCRGELVYLFDTKLIHETFFRQHCGNGKYSPATLQSLIMDYSIVASSDYDSIVLVLYSNSRENVTEYTVSAIRDIFVSGRNLKRCMLRVSESLDVRDGEVVLKVVQSTDGSVNLTPKFK